MALVTSRLAWIAKDEHGGAISPLSMRHLHWWWNCLYNMMICIALHLPILVLKYMCVQEKMEIHGCPVMTVQRKKAIMLIHGVLFTAFGDHTTPAFAVPTK